MVSRSWWMRPAETPSRFKVRCVESTPAFGPTMT